MLDVTKVVGARLENTREQKDSRPLFTFSQNQPFNPATTSMSLHSQRISSTILGKTEGRWVALCRPHAIRSLPTGMSFNPDYVITGSGVSK